MKDGWGGAKTFNIYTVLKIKSNFKSEKPTILNTGRISNKNSYSRQSFNF